jgi:hypothetical protein
VIKLSTPEVAALVDSYRAGATVYELATRFGIHRVTVSAHEPVLRPHIADGSFADGRLDSNTGPLRAEGRRNPPSVRRIRVS